MLGADGKAVDAKGLKWELLRLDQRWQWYSRDGSWNYEPVTQHPPRRLRHGRRRTRQARRQDRGRASTGAAIAWRCQRRDGSDLQHRVQCRLLGRRRPPTAPRCSTSRSTSRPTRSGDTARVKITSRMAGRALVAVMSSGLASTQEVDLPAGGGEMPDPRRQRLEPRRLRHRHALSAHGREGQAHAEPRAGPALARRRPGAAHAQRQLDAPEKVKSGAMLTVPVKLTGPGRRRGGARHGCRHRRRHPQPDALRDAQAARAGSSASADSAPRSATSTAA